jgi:DNA-binding MarR family transcriptional regulator
MRTFGKKEKELMDHMEAVVHHYALTRAHTGDAICRKPEMKIVDILGRNGPMIMSEIADRAMLSVSTVTGITDSLVAKSLVQRERSEEDRRVVRVELTEEGKKIYKEALEFRSAIVRGMLGALNKEEQEALMNLFRKIVQRIEREKKASIVA